MRNIWRTTAAAAALATALAAPAYADPDDDDTTTNEICGAFNLGVAPGDIPGRLGANDGRWNYWRAQQKTRDTIVEGGCG